MERCCLTSWQSVMLSKSQETPSLVHGSIHKKKKEMSVPALKRTL